MFDDQPINLNPGGAVPNNLPIGEPVIPAEDMFAGVEEEAGAVTAIEAPIPKSALSAGILKPRAIETPMNQPSMGQQTGNNFPPQMPEQANNDVYKIKQPMMSSGIARMVMALVVLGILGGGGWWIYNSFVKTPEVKTVLPTDITFPEISAETNVTIETSEVAPAIDNNEVAGEQNNVAGDVKDDQVLFGQPIDKDGDGLDDAKEQELGTDPNNWDTDNDGLSDGDEVLIWKTLPLNPDTDGDTYLDGAEVKNGYNPAGAGKLFEPPTQ